MSKHQFQVGTLLRRLSVNAKELGDSEFATEQLSEQLEIRKGNSPHLETSEDIEVADVEPLDDSEAYDDEDDYESDDEEAKQIEDELAKQRSEIEEGRRARRRIVDELKKLEPDAAELVDSTPEELSSWAEAYFPHTPTSQRFEKLIGTHTDWQTRLGRAGDFESALVLSSQVVAGTCVGLAAIKGIQDIEFDLCILDEASKATPTESLVPMARSRRWIIVGDSRQLPPFIEEGIRDRRILEANNLEEEVLAHTLFDRFEQLLPDECKTTLSIQHRMVPGIGNLISECFYAGQLQSAPLAWDAVFHRVLPRPVVWLTTAHEIDRLEHPSGHSFDNPAEARVICDLLRRLDGFVQGNRRRISVVLLTGYTAQKHLLERALAAAQFSGLEVSCHTVDSVQGREADVAIYSVTRSNSSRQLGHLKEAKRLNVALSRSRQYLVIVGDHVFAREAGGENPFKQIMEYIDQHPADCSLKEFKG